MKRLIILLAFLLPVVACEKEQAHTPGEADLPDCYRVYFPEQGGYGAHALRPSAARVFTYTAVRERTDGAITVPVTIESTSDAFQADPIHFEDGQAQTTFSVHFEGLEEQVEHSFSLEITDPQYASRYRQQRRYVAFSVLVGNRKIEPSRRTDWTFQYYSGYYYVRVVDGYYGFYTVPASAGSPKDPAYVKEVLETYNSELEDHYDGITPVFLTDYSTAAWALFSGSLHYGATPKSSGGSGPGDYYAFMIGVTQDPYCTGEYQYIELTVE